MSKISELSDGGSLVSSDYLIAVRSGGNVKVRMDSINVDQVDLGDNEFIRLGNSQDLTMVHTSTQSIINQAGIGDLLLQKAGATKLTINATGIDVTGNTESDTVTIGVSSVAGSEKLRVNGTVLTLGGSVSAPAIGIGDTNTGVYAPSAGQLGWTVNGTQRLFLDSTGIDVTGTVTADGLTVDGNTQFNSASAAASGTRSIQFYRDSAERGAVRFDYSASAMELQADGSFFVSTGGEGTSLRIDGSTRDISFYNSAGNSQALFWDASAERLGIGTSSPNNNIQIKTATNGGGLTLQRDSVTEGDYSQLSFVPSTSDTADVRGWIRGHRGSLSTNTYLTFGTDNTERMHIDSAGDVGIGVVPKTGSSTWQHIQFGGTGNLIARKDDSIVDAMFSNNYYVNASNADSYITTGAAARMFMNDNVISFDQAASGSTDAAISWSEAMRLDASGRLLIGQTVVSTGGSNGDDGLVYVNGGVVREGVIFDDFDNVWVQTNGAIIEGRSNFDPSNKPNTENWFFVTATSIDTGGSSVYCVQTATSLTGRIYTRYNNNITGQGSGSGAWSSWVEK